MGQAPAKTPRQAVKPFLITFDEDALSDTEMATLEMDRRIAAKRGGQIMNPGSGRGEFITGIEELKDGRVHVFTELKVVRETVRRFTVRTRGGGWVVEKCHEPCPVCQGKGVCHICGETAHPGACFCCDGKGWHREKFLFIIPMKRPCMHCEGSGECFACTDGECKHCDSKGWVPSVSFKSQLSGKMSP